MSLQPSEVFI